MNTEAIPSSAPFFDLTPTIPLTPQTARFSGISVLLVDDDPADVSLILGVLKRHPRVSMARATDAPVFALREIEAGRLSADLVLLDIHMPKMDGFEFLEEMRDLPKMAGVPVVFL